MTAGPLENKRGEPSLAEKKIHEELKQLRVREPAARRRLSANKFAIGFDSSGRQRRVNTRELFATRGPELALQSQPTFNTTLPST